MTDKYQVMDLLRKHPDWSSSQIAQRLKCMPEYVRATIKRNGLTLASTNRSMAEIYALGKAAAAAGLTLEDITEIAKQVEAA